MKKSLFLAAALCSSVAANAALSTSPSELINNDYVKEWGRLKLVGNQLSSESGQAIQLKGWSTFSINYNEVVNCLTQDGFKAMKAWGANIVRLAIYPKNSNGSYSQGTDAKIKQYIDWANGLGMYVLVDWHVLEGDGDSGNPATFQNEAKGMFQRICSYVSSQKYKNVLYEICNECSGVSWDNIKSYADQVLPIIQTNDPGAIVVVGTPQWDQNIGEAVNSPIAKTKYPNLGLMYAFHYYACSHAHLLGGMQSAAASLPVFISEWGSVRFDGAGGFCGDASDQFLSTLEKGGNNGNQWISWCYWAWGQKNETSNCLKNCGASYTPSDLTQAGEYIVGVLTGSKEILPPPASEAWCEQPIPASGEKWGVLNVAWFDKSGEGVSYHDANSSAYSDDEHTIENPAGTESKCCNAGAVYSGKEDLTECFRYDECVDVSNSTAGLGANWGSPGDGYGNEAGDLHNLCSNEPGEWVIYTIDVKTPGYYTVACLTNSTTNKNGSIGMAIAKGTQPGQNGNIIRSWDSHDDKEALAEDPWVSFSLDKTPKCGQMLDGSVDPDGAAKGNPAEDWTCWGWTKCGGTEADDLTVLFKYAGVQKLQLSISPDVEEATGDFSNFLFTLKSTDIPDFEFEASTEGVNTVSSLDNIVLYPNPTTGAFTVKNIEKANVSVFNSVAAMVYNQNVEGEAVIDANLSAGIYTVRVATAAGVKSFKLIVK